MNSGRSYIGSAEHAADIHAVTSAADNQLIAKIRSFEATGNEVVAWYGTADPCYEDMRLQIYGQLASSTYSPEEHLGRYLRETVKETTTHQAAAFTMLADVAGIIEHREDQGPWHTSNHPLLETTRNQPGEIIAKRMVDSITPTLKIDDFDKLYIAADCLHEAGRGFGYLHSLQQNGILGTRHPADFAERSQSYISTATFLAKNMVERILTDSTETEQVAARPTLHKLGAFLCNISLEESLRHNRNSGSGKDMNQPEKVAIGNLVSLIRTSYLDLDKSKVVKGSEKGDLHELVYLLDLNYLLCTRRPTSGDWVAKASTLRQDAPKIGYPRKNRGSDFLITDGDIGFQVQLKSSKADTSEYHPWILKIEEDNFQDVDKRRLRAKLNAYQEWIDSDFDPDMRHRIEKYILPSASETYDKVLEADALSDSGHAIRALENTLSRAEIRRIKRNSGEFKGKRTKRDAKLRAYRK